MTRLPADGYILFGTRVVRMFAYGFLSVVLVLYLAHLGLSGGLIGLLLSLTLIGDAAISLWMTTTADRIGRRRILIAGAALMLFAGVLFAVTDRVALLLIAAIIGVISPSGYEVGPFLPVEQSALSQIVPDKVRTQVFAWYNLVGSFATAAGALCGGGLTQLIQQVGISPLNSYRTVLVLYGVMGVLLAGLFTQLSPAVEALHSSGPQTPTRFGLHRSRNIVLKLSALFGLDAFAGGFVVQSLVAYWFHVRFGVEPAVLGGIFFGANILAGISALAAARVAQRIGLVNTMVFSHLPSNILLMVVPFMPNLPSAIVVLFARFAISQMDVPPRQSYTMAVVAPDERSAAAGITAIARSIGAAISPTFTGAFLSNPVLLGVPFFLAGGLKVIYDILLYRSFRQIKERGYEDALLGKD
ncbi:MAG TPA: MFS transporter [Chthoniobacterales bacterium]|nr:MFS transporter [Chthoniobacterales bacterium]